MGNIVQEGSIIFYAMNEMKNKLKGSILILLKLLLLQKE